MTRWSQYGCWIALQTAIPSPSGAAMKACGSIANWVTIGKAYVPSTTRSACAGRRVDVAPAVSGARGGRSCAASGSSGRSDGILDERRVGGEGGGDREDAPAAPRTRPRRGAAASSAASWVSAATAATGSPWYFVSPMASTGRSRRCGPKRGIGCGQVGRRSSRGGRRGPRARPSRRSGRSARARTSSVTSFTWRTSSMAAGRRRTACSPGDAVAAADAGCRLPDAHCGATSASGTADRSPTGGAAFVALVGVAVRGGLDRLDDLLVAGAAAEVAGEALLDLGARRVRRRREQRLRRDAAGPGCRTRTGGARVEERRWSGWSRSPVASPSTVVDGRAVRLDREHQARIDAPAVDDAPCTRRTRRRGSTPSCRSGRGRRAGPRAACDAARRRSSAARPLTVSSIGQGRVIAAPRLRASRSTAVATARQPEDAEHRQPVLRARAHRAWRRAGAGEQRLEHAPPWRASRRSGSASTPVSSTTRTGRGPTLPYASRVDAVAVDGAGQRHRREVVTAPPRPPQVDRARAGRPGIGSSMAVTSSPRASVVTPDRTKNSSIGIRPRAVRSGHDHGRAVDEQRRRRVGGRARRCRCCRRASRGCGSGPTRRRRPPRPGPGSRAGSAGRPRCRSSPSARRSSAGRPRLAGSRRRARRSA